MLFLLFGSSCAGKTSVLAELRTRAVEDLAIHDFDEIGVPPGADRAWRQDANEIWVQRGVASQVAGIDLLLAGQTPLGELLATPSAASLDAISACLLDCDDETRIRRIEERGEDWLTRSPGTLRDYLNWAAWMRGHAADPQWRVDVIRRDEGPSLQWNRWDGWKAGDPRWRVHVIDTSRTDVALVADGLLEWIEAERALHRSGDHPLTGWARP